MQPVTSDTQRITDQFNRLGLGMSTAVAHGHPQQAPTPHEFTIGRGNPALADLQRRKSTLNARQTGVVNELEQFYKNTERPVTNNVLYALPSNSSTGRVGAQELNTMQRRASFLLNLDAMNALPDALQDIPNEAGAFGVSTATLEVNAILNSIKGQSEHVMAAALQDARNGNRLCPLTLSETNFPIFMTLQSRAIREIAAACALPQPAREQALPTLLKRFSDAYFAYSHNYPGAPRVQPDELQVKLKPDARTKTSTTFTGKIVAKIAIDPAEVEEFCRTPAIDATECQDGAALSRAYIMRGFESHPIAQKRAAFYLQRLLSDLSEIQEVVGADSADKPRHGPDAQQAAQRTIDEMYYNGSARFGDRVQTQGPALSDRERATYALRIIPTADRAFRREYGTPLISAPAVGAWVHTPAFQFDLAALREPGARLLLQVAPLTGRTLLSMPEFGAA